MHSWGNWPDEMFSKVGDAAYEIGTFCRRWGRLAVTDSKEKYGTVRVYLMFGCRDLHGFFYPGYVYIGYPRWLFKLVGKNVGWHIMTFPFFRPVQSLVFHWQKFIYRLAYKRALKKFPEIKEEILCCADFDEFLEGL